VKILQWILPSVHRTQRVLFSCACLHTNSNAHLAEFCHFHKTLNGSVFFRALIALARCPPRRVSFSLRAYALAQCPPGRAFQNPQRLCFSFQISAEFFLQHLVLTLNAHLVEPYRTPKRLCLQLCLLPHSLTS
jgi:hypothetical protein